MRPAESPGIRQIGLQEAQSISRIPSPLPIPESISAEAITNTKRTWSFFKGHVFQDEEEKLRFEMGKKGGLFDFE